MNICKSVCICSLSNSKIRRSTDSVDLLNANYVSAMSPTCMQQNSDDIYYFYMSAQPFTQMQHPCAESTILHPQELKNAHPSICSMRVFSSRSSAQCVYMHPRATTSNHLHPLATIKHNMSQTHVYTHQFLPKVQIFDRQDTVE